MLLPSSGQQGTGQCNAPACQFDGWLTARTSCASTLTWTSGASAAGLPAPVTIHRATTDSTASMRLSARVDGTPHARTLVHSCTFSTLARCTFSTFSSLDIPRVRFAAPVNHSHEERLAFSKKGAKRSRRLAPSPHPSLPRARTSNRHCAHGYTGLSPGAGGLIC